MGFIRHPREALLAFGFFFVFLAPLLAHALVTPPDPFDATDRYALLLAAEDGRIIAVVVKVRVPGKGDLRAVLSYRLPSGADREIHQTSVSAPVPAEGAESVTAVLAGFDLAAASVPAEAYHRTLDIFFQQDPGTPPVVIAEYRPEQLISRPSGSAVTTPLTAVQTARAGIIVFGPVTVIREREKPRTEHFRFTLPDVSGVYLLRLANGDPGGSRRAASAVVTLNGKEVFRPSEFNQKTAGLTRQIVPLSGENLLDIRLRSVPGALVFVEIVRLDGNVCRALGPHTFLRATGKPATETVTFQLNPQLHGPFTMIVINGNADGSSRVDSAVISINGQNVFSQNGFNEQTGQVSRIVSLQDSNSMRVELQGKPGDFLTLEITGFDSTPPRIAITSPANGTFVSAHPITVTGTTDDPYATVTVNGILAAIASNGTFTSEGVTLQEGENPVAAVATDSCGNEGRDQISVHLQTVAIKGPELILCAERFSEQTPRPPEDDCSQVAYSGSWGLITGLVGETAVTVTLNGTPMPDGVEVNEQGNIFWGMREGNFIWAFVYMPGPDGPYPFTAVAVDSQGGKTTVPATIVKDTVRPRVTITSPPDRTVTNASSITITGTVDDPIATLWLSSAFTSLTLTDGFLSGQASLPSDGSHYVYVYVRDRARNYGYASIFVTRDTIAPTFAVTSPTDGMITNSPTISVAGVIFDQTPDAATVSVNDGASQTIAASGSSFSGTVALSPNRNILTFQAKDKAGNLSSPVTRSVILDQDPPAVAITSPLPESSLTGAVTIAVSANDALAEVKSVTMLIDGQVQKTLNQEPYNFALNTLSFPAGSHILTAKAMDTIGNQSEASIPVTIQSQLGIEIITPIAGSILNKQTVLVQGRINPYTNSEAGVTVNGALAQQNGNIFAAIVPLQPGQNTLTAVVSNEYGIKEQVSRTITVETAAEPIWLLVLPDSGIPKINPDGSASFVTTLEAETNLPADVSNYSWDTNGDGVPDQAGPILTKITASYETPGLYFPTVTITDAMGNAYRETTIVNVLDRTAIDSLLKAKWEGMKGALSRPNVQEAASFFTDKSRERYSAIFTSLGGSLPQVAANMSEIGLIKAVGDMAKYRIKRMESAGEITYYIYFIKDANGIWKIQQL